MANTPKRVTDPTEAALSAIQDALSVRDAATESEPVNPAVEQSAPASAIDEPLSEAPWRGGHSSAAADEMLRDEEIRPPEEQISLRRPANDDRESIGQILRTLQRRPARTSYIIATVFAVAWVIAGLGLGWMYLPQLQAGLSPTGLTAPVLGMLAAIFFAPIIFFYVLAQYLVAIVRPEDIFE